jgi:hypothetical protein
VWTWIVIYECEGERLVKCGGKYHAKMIATYLLAGALRELEDKQIVDSYVLYIPEDKQTVSD